MLGLEMILLSSRSGCLGMNGVDRRRSCLSRGVVDLVMGNAISFDEAAEPDVVSTEPFSVVKNGA